MGAFRRVISRNARPVRSPGTVGANARFVVGVGFNGFCIFMVVFGISSSVVKCKIRCWLDY